MDTQSQSNKHILRNLAIFTFLVITLGWIGKYCSFHINRYWVTPAEKEKNGGHTKIMVPLHLTSDMQNASTTHLRIMLRWAWLGTSHDPRNVIRQGAFRR